MAERDSSSSNSSFGSQGHNPIRGMESVIATVSGYHGTERFKLIKLIAQTGASYVGAMDRSTTHLVCWRFKGKKFDLARELGTHIVGHCWFEDCLKQGKCLSESPYTMQSGQEAGPISWEFTSACDTHGKKKNLSNKKRNVLSDLSNDLEFHEVDKDDSVFDISFPDWSDSHLLNELESRSLLPKRSSSSKRNFNDVSGIGSSLGPARRSRRLVKKSSSDNPLNSVILDSQLTSSRRSLKDNNPVYVDLDNLSSMIEPSVQEVISENVSTIYEESGRDAPQLNEDIGELINYDLINNSNISSICASSAPRTSQNEHYDHTQEKIKFCDVEDNQNEETNESGEVREAAVRESKRGLSCVICFTEFCSTRGVLPCGHRFCYACIQQWADYMTSRGKISTCPLCKTSFSHITKYEENANASYDQKIYSQNIPCGSLNTDIVMLSSSRHESHDHDSWPSDSICYQCHNRDPDNLLVCCRICQNQWVHSCCLDPPLIPWTCVRCSDFRLLYQRFH